MKKFFLFLFIIQMLFPISVYAVDSNELLKNAKSGILMEYSTGEILFEKEKDLKVPIASLTKMVAQIIILEKIEDGTLHWDDIITCSSNASSMGGTQIWLTTGEKISVEDLFKGLSMASANDATIALAEEIAGTEEDFVKLMNDKVKSLGLKNTVFKNCTGLDEEGHFSTSYDLAIIAKELLRHDILKYSSVYEDYIRKDTPNKFWVVNTNKLVRFYEGCDGLKTGFTDNAKYTMAVTAKRNNMRLIAIVLGEDVSKVRNQETSDLLDYGFGNYKLNLIKSGGEVIDVVDVSKADVEKVNIVLKNDLSVLQKKTDKNINYDYKVTINELTIPLSKGDVVGKIDLINNNKVVKSSDLIVLEDVHKINYLEYLLNGFINAFSLNFN